MTTTSKRGKDWYYFPKGEYSSQFLKAVAMANHVGKLDPTELQYWFDNNWSQREITLELYNRVKRPQQPTYSVDDI